MHVIIIKLWRIKLFKIISFCAISLEINQWNVHCLTPVWKTWVRQRLFPGRHWSGRYCLWYRHDFCLSECSCIYWCWVEADILLTILVICWCRPELLLCPEKIIWPWKFWHCHQRAPWKTQRHIIDKDGAQNGPQDTSLWDGGCNRLPIWFLVAKNDPMFTVAEELSHQSISEVCLGYRILLIPWHQQFFLLLLLILFGH